MRKLLEDCPSCGGPLEITALACLRCDTRVEGHFRPCTFCRLTDEQSTFLQLFVQGRGNLSEMEKVLGISYPTVRGKLEEIIRLLSQPAAPTPAPPAARTAPDRESPERATILRQVADGTLDATEGLARLRSMSGETK